MTPSYGDNEVYELSYENGAYYLPNGNEYETNFLVKTNFFDDRGWRLYVDYYTVVNGGPIYGMIAKSDVDGSGHSYTGGLYDAPTGAVENLLGGGTSLTNFHISVIQDNLALEYHHPGSEHLDLYDESGQQVFWNDAEGWYVNSNGDSVAGFALFTGPNALDGTSTMVYDGSEWGEWEYNQMTMTWEPLP